MRETIRRLRARHSGCRQYGRNDPASLEQLRAIFANEQIPTEFLLHYEKVLTGHGAAIDTTSAAGKLVFGIFAALAEFERERISERTVAGLASARARGSSGGRPFKMTPAKLRQAMAAMGKPET